VKTPVTIAPEALDFTQLIRAGETVGWAEATAEPVFLTRLLDAQAERCPPFRVFFALTFSDGFAADHPNVTVTVLGGALAQRLDEDLLRLSRQRNDSGGLVLGLLSSSRTLMYAGRFVSSRPHLEEALALYDPVFHRSLVQQAGFHPHVAVQGYLGIVLFCLGYPDQALAQSNAGIAEA
jgi:hypothetical protein